MRHLHATGGAPVVIVTNDALAPPGYLAEALEAATVPFEVVPAYDGTRLPEIGTFRALVILGGHMGAYEEDRYPFLTAEKTLIRDAVDRDLPVLGICLGAQLVADALGGRAYLAESPEVAVTELTLSPEGASDPVGCRLDGPFLTFHQDTFDPPPGSTVLASTDRYPQAFRCGSALAVQAHPEASAEIVEPWLAMSDLPQRVGADGTELLEKLGAEAVRENALSLFAAWIEEVAAP